MRKQIRDGASNLNSSHIKLLKINLFVEYLVKKEIRYAMCRYWNP